MSLFYDLSDAEREKVKELLEVSTELDEMDRTEKDLLMHLEARAVDHKGVLDGCKVNQEDMRIIRGWVGYGFIKWIGVEADPEARGYLRANYDVEINPINHRSAGVSGDTHVMQFADEFIDMAHQERKNRIRRTEVDIDEFEKGLEESRGESRTTEANDG